MMHVHIFADVFGRVKTINGTSVVTRFWGVNSFPLVPTESYYVAANSTEHQQGVPVVAIRCASVDRTSAAMAYTRGLCGTLFVLGFIGTAFGLYSDWLAIGPGPDELGKQMIRVLMILFVVGGIAGVLTYFVPVTSRREGLIRVLCGSLLGPAIDPAKLQPSDAAEIQQSLIEPRDEDPVSDVSRNNHLRRQLVLMRCHIAQGNDIEVAERATDQLLSELVKS